MAQALLARLQPADILIVEDDPLIAQNFARELERRGHSVRCAQSGREAQELADRSEPELVGLALRAGGAFREAVRGRAAASVRELPRFDESHDRMWHTFSSDTDTEVLAHLIEELYDGKLEDAVIEALRKVEGTYGIAVVSSHEPQTIVAARKGSPLLVGVGDGEYFVASDVAAILQHTRDVVYLDDGDVAVLDEKGYRLCDLNAEVVHKKSTRIEWDLDEIE